MMKEQITQMEQGAKVILHEWIKVKPWDKVLIVSTQEHLLEVDILYKEAQKKSCMVKTLIVECSGRHVGVFFDEHEKVFDSYTVIVAATDYSLVTTKAAKRAIQMKKKFLSLPLSTNDKRTLLEYEFLMMDTKKSRMMAQIVINYLKEASEIHVTTEAGTDLRFAKVGRKPGFFNGVLKDGKGYSSASIELYIPIEEDKTEGVMVVDGSFGYIGKAEEPVKIVFCKGRIINIEETSSGKHLREYMEGYKDPRIYIAGELGIGLNSYAKCEGNCYIEDESAYGTFHVGVGRNLALGGKQNANGHFDLVAMKPNIYADNRQIMHKGKIIVPEPLPY